MDTKWSVYVLVAERTPVSEVSLGWDLIAWNTDLDVVWSELLARIARPPEGGLQHFAYAIQSVSHRDFSLRWTSSAVDKLLREMLVDGVHHKPIIKVDMRHGPFPEFFDTFEEG